MKKLILGVYLACLASLSCAQIQVQLDSSQINLGDTFKLSFTLSDTQNSNLPDLTPLQKDFIILGTERNINYSVINGQAQTLSQWVIALKAKKKGILTIPPIKIGLDQSASLTINVEGNAQAQDLQNNTADVESVMLKATVDQPNPYINQQVLYTVRLYNNARLMDASYQGPQVDDALLIPLGGEKRYQTQINNVAYEVEEQNYAVFPQKSGIIKILSPTFNALIYDYNAQRIQAKDKPVKLAVQPIPHQFENKSWLPAKHVSLEEHYEDLAPNLAQGSSITRTIQLAALGTPAQLIPALKFESQKDFQVYPEKGAERNQLRQGQLIGTTEMKVTYLFNTAGKVTIPEVKVSWFNTQTGKEEQVVLESKTININPSSTTANIPVTPNSKEPSVTESVTVSSLTANDNKPWITALFFAIAWIVTLGFLGWQKHSKKWSRGRHKKVMQALTKACTANNPIAARKAVMEWGTVHWPDAQLLNLGDLMQLVKGVSLKKQLQLLSQALYNNEQESNWHGEALLAAILKEKPHSAVKKKKVKDLPPINP